MTIEDKILYIQKSHIKSSFNWGNTLCEGQSQTVQLPSFILNSTKHTHNKAAPGTMLLSRLITHYIMFLDLNYRAFELGDPIMEK